jgi:hypothetical protein
MVADWFSLLVIATLSVLQHPVTITAIVGDLVDLLVWQSCASRSKVMVFGILIPQRPQIIAETWHLAQL